VRSAQAIRLKLARLSHASVEPNAWLWSRHSPPTSFAITTQRLSLTTTEPFVADAYCTQISAEETNTLALQLATMDSTTESPITVIVNSIKGHDIAFTSPKDASLTSIYDTLYERAPWVQNSSYILTTNSRRAVSHDESPVSSLLSSPSDTFLSLRLTVPLCGGKGGFGSILRAQGGRMSSRKKQGGDANASSRNLDGRRLRTVAEAKVLAEYLAIKPEMEQREKEERRKRWEDIVTSTERKQDELMNSRGTARLDGKWVEDKEEAENKTREAIEKMLLAQRESSEEEDDDTKPAASSSKPVQQRQMFGWDDEDDEFMSDSEEEEDVSEDDAKPQVFEGKGKGKATA
jgi:hypothetical protein